MVRTPTLLFALLVFQACTAIGGDSHVFVASTPAGAEILVDGVDTGLTTPAMVELGGMFGGDREITMRLEGREPETRWVRHHRLGRTSEWSTGGDDTMLGWALPLWWTLGDWFVPFELTHRYAPHEVHATLYPEGEAPVRAESQ